MSVADAQRHLARIDALTQQIGRPICLMEVCGTHTMAAFRSGLRSLLPDNVRLLSGPGCPVCVTPNDYIDFALAIADQTDVEIATFGDMIRVPGSERSLEQARATGANVRVVYSPQDALEHARADRHRVVFLGVGFETTAPTVAWTIAEARRTGVENYGVLCGHKTMPAAMRALLQAGDVQIDGFLCPGHVSVVIGADAYAFIADEFHTPCVVSGFEPEDMLEAVEMLLAQIAEHRSEVEIQYRRSVGRTGNTAALAMIYEVFEPCDAAWRGLGTIPESGLRIRETYRAHDAAVWFEDLDVPPPREPQGCICGDVLRGIKTPLDCPLFAKRCTPRTPVGTCMVSSEGTCAAYYKYGGHAL